MKRIFVISLLFAAVFASSAQDYMPTINWPYLYPEFYEGELAHLGGKTSKAKLNINLGQGKLHMVGDDGMIGEVSVSQVISLNVCGDEFRNVGGKMLKVLARSEKGYVVEETLANYSAVVRQDGAYGGSNANAAQGYSYDENYGNYAYLITNNYEDLLSQKEYGEELPVTVQRFIVINGISVPAARKSVAAMEGVDKKEFAAFLKENKIDWKNPQDVLKVIGFVVK